MPITYTAVTANALALAMALVTVTFLLTTPAHAQTCHLITSQHSASDLPAGFGVPWNTLTSAKELLIRASCGNTSATVDLGTGSEWQYIYKHGYQWRNDAWQEITFTGANTAEDWLIGSAKTTLNRTTSEMQNPNWFVAYICQWTGGQWKCGCRDQACTTPMWQLQGFMVASSPSPGGGVSQVTPCSNPTTYNVTPGNFRTVLDSRANCSVLNLAPGTHPNAGTVRDTAGITIRCTEPGKCVISRIVTWRIKTVIIENMKFVGTAASYPGGTSSEDYGIRIHHADAFRAENNIFNGRYHHDISTKELVDYMEVLNNTFIKCERHCVELSQNAHVPSNPTQGRLAIVRGNTFDSPVLSAITNRYQSTLIVEENVFKNVGGYSVNNWLFYRAKYKDEWPMTPKAPLRTTVRNNTFEGSNKLRFEGRGRHDDVVLIQGNKGSFSCSRPQLESRSAEAHTGVETRNGPKLDPASNVSC